MPEKTSTYVDSTQKDTSNLELCQNGSSYINNDTNTTNKGIYLKFPNVDMQINGQNTEKVYDYPKFDFTKIAQGFYGTVQNSLIETLTVQGSDTAHPERGTTLQEETITAFITNNTDLIHSCNFAAETVRLNQNNDLLSNYRETITIETENGEDSIIYNPMNELVSPGIDTYKLMPESYELDSCKLQAYFKSTEGEEYGINLSTNMI